MTMTQSVFQEEAQARNRFETSPDFGVSSKSTGLPLINLFEDAPHKVSWSVRLWQHFLSILIFVGEAGVHP
jgi:hypothetical protein